MWPPCGPVNNETIRNNVASLRNSNISTIKNVDSLQISKQCNNHNDVVSLRISTYWNYLQ